MWETRREDVLTTLNVLKELGYATEESVVHTIEQLDRVLAARKASKGSK